MSITSLPYTPGLAVARLMMSLAVANDMELHKIDIEQAFLQADKIDEGVNGRYFINPPPGSPEAGIKNIVYEVLRPLTIVHRHQERTKPWTRILNLKGSIPLVSRSPCGYDLQVANTRRTSMCQLVDDCLLSCKSLTVMAEFKAHMLERFVGEGEVDVGCELVRDRKAHRTVDPGRTC